MGNPFMGCCCDEGPPFCWPTVHVEDCDGSPIEHAVVTITRCPAFGGPTPISGETDVDGNYLFPLASVPPLTAVQYNCYSITWDGATYGPFFGISDTIYNCTHTIDFCYDHATVTITSTAAAAPDLEPGSFGRFVKSIPSAGTILLTYKTLRYCAATSALPATITPVVVPADPTKYLNNCATFTVHCGDALAESIPLFEWDTDYTSFDPGFCDRGCTDHGEGPDYRGLTPKVLFWTPSTITGLGLGTLDGSTITVTWNGSYWDSGCLAVSGARCCTAGVYGPFYATATLRIYPLILGETFYFDLALYPSADCTVNTAPFTCQDQHITSGITGPACLPYFYSPLDVTLGAAPQCGFGSYQFHITE